MKGVLLGDIARHCEGCCAPLYVPKFAGRAAVGGEYPGW